MKKICYIDMDGVIVDFQSGIDLLDEKTYKKYYDNFDEVPSIFGTMKPINGSIEAIKILSKHFDVYILSSPSWRNSTSYSDKAEWIHKYFGKDKDSPLYKRLILSHHKNLNNGDFLIDDRTKNGVSDFGGEHIHFGTEDFPDWNSVLKYLIPKK